MHEKKANPAIERYSPDQAKDLIYPVPRVPPVPYCTPHWPESAKTPAFGDSGQLAADRRAGNSGKVIDRIYGEPYTFFVKVSGWNPTGRPRLIAGWHKEALS